MSKKGQVYRSSAGRRGEKSSINGREFWRTNDCAHCKVFRRELCISILCVFGFALVICV